MVKIWRKSATVKTLELLKDSIEPLTARAIMAYLEPLGYSRVDVHNTLRRLEKFSFIDHDNRVRNKNYRINEKGLSFLYHYRQKQNIRTSLGKLERILLERGIIND